MIIVVHTSTKMPYSKLPIQRASSTWLTKAMTALKTRMAKAMTVTCGRLRRVRRRKTAGVDARKMRPRPERQALGQEPLRRGGRGKTQRDTLRQQRRVVDAMRGIERRGDAAGEQAGYGAGMGRPRRRGVAQRKEENGKRTEADQRDGGQADFRVGADPARAPFGRWQHHQFHQHGGDQQRRRCEDCQARDTGRSTRPRHHGKHHKGGDRQCERKDKFEVEAHGAHRLVDVRPRPEHREKDSSRKHCRGRQRQAPGHAQRHRLFHRIGSQRLDQIVCLHLNSSRSGGRWHSNRDAVRPAQRLR
jgi:hypothetical protein